MALAATCRDLLEPGISVECSAVWGGQRGSSDWTKTEAQPYLCRMLVSSRLFNRQHSGALSCFVLFAGNGNACAHTP